MSVLDECNPTNILNVEILNFRYRITFNLILENTLCENNNGGCSTFCFPNAIGRTCACEDGVELRNKQLCTNGNFPKSLKEISFIL